jgi:hypothetical protein
MMLASDATATRIFDCIDSECFDWSTTTMANQQHNWTRKIKRKRWNVIFFCYSVALHRTLLPHPKLTEQIFVWFVHHLQCLRCRFELYRSYNGIPLVSIKSLQRVNKRPT